MHNADYKKMSDFSFGVGSYKVQFLNLGEDWLVRVHVKDTRRRTRGWRILELLHSRAPCCMHRAFEA